MQFTKMEGLGNDYIYINCLEAFPEELSALAVRLSDRHFGVGGDGLICIGPGREGDFSMHMFNADGSRGMMCGNGIRCVGKYVYDKKLTRKRCLTIDTDAGPRELRLEVRREQVVRVSVNMGRPEVSPPREVRLEGSFFPVQLVSVGNPHAVVFCGDPDAIDLEREGPLLENCPSFPGRVNVEFATLLRPDLLDVRVWERGSGVTLACGTGACACFAAARSRGLCRDRAVVRLPGGELELCWEDGTVWMAGPARTVFEGELTEEA